MRLGVIDIGSNTVHLLVVQAERDARPDPAASEREVLRLMRFLQPDGSISDEGVAHLVRAVRAMAEGARRARVDQLVGMCTSAVREATNGAAVLEELEEAAGVPIRVLSGSEEADLTFLAARRWHGWAVGRLLVLDIGGGSFEVAMGIDERPEFSASLPLGAGRLTVDFLPDDPPTKKQLATLQEYIKDQLTPLRKQLKRLPAPDHVVATSKTFRSVARLAGQLEAVVGPEERRRMTLADLQDWVPRLAKIPAEQRMELPGITPERTHQIVAGAMVAEKAMKAFGLSSIEICPWALREGVILRMIDGL